MRSWTDRISAFVQSAEFWRAFADRRSSSTWREASSNFCSETSRSTSFQEGGADGVGVGVRIADTAAGFFWGPGAAAHAMAASAAAIATPTHRPDARMAVILPTEEPARPEKFLGSAPYRPSSRAVCAVIPSGARDPGLLHPRRNPVRDPSGLRPSG